jgi:hypothetical protein
MAVEETHRPQRVRRHGLSTALSRPHASRSALRLALRIVVARARWRSLPRQLAETSLVGEGCGGPTGVVACAAAGVRRAVTT